MFATIVKLSKTTQPWKHRVYMLGQDGNMKLWKCTFSAKRAISLLYVAAPRVSKCCIQVDQTARNISAVVRHATTDVQS